MSHIGNEYGQRRASDEPNVITSPDKAQNHDHDDSDRSTARTESPLFSKLPAELRTLIYTELFGGRRVHLGFMTHPIRNDKVGNRRRWRHGICEEERASVPFDRVINKNQHYCLSVSRRRVLDISLLFTCRQALVEGIPVLYQSNVFFIVNTGNMRLPVDDIRSLQVKIPNHWHLVRALEIQWDVGVYDRNKATAIPHIWGRVSYEALWDALAEMPALSHLRIALFIPGLPWPGTSLTPAELRELYLGPIRRLKNLRSCEVVFPELYRPHLALHEDPSFFKCHETCQYRVSWANRPSLDVGYASALTLHPHLSTASLNAIHPDL